MKFFKVIMLCLVLTGTYMHAKTMNVNDYIKFWTPVLTRQLESVKNLLENNDLAHEAEDLIAEWQTFNRQLSPRKSNQKVFLRLSKRNEALLNKVVPYHDKVQEFLNELHKAQNNVRGKK